MAEVETGIVDYAKLLADLRAGDAAAIERAYHDTFAGQVGRFVLIHFLHDCGVGQSRSRDMGGEARAYEDGRVDAALRLMELAGYGQQAAAVVAVADTLEGQDERHDASPAGRYDDGDGGEPDFG